MAKKKRKQLSPEAKAKALENLKKAREAKKAKEAPTPSAKPPKEKKPHWVGGHTLEKEPVG